MYIAALIGSILAFVCSFIPLFGMPFTIVFSITSIVFSIIILKKQIPKERKDASVISIIISIIAIIICLFINILSAKFIIEVYNTYYENQKIDYSNYYEKKFANYLLYSKEDNDIKNEKFKIKINNISQDGEFCYVEIDLESLIDNNYVDLYYFGVYNAEINDFTYNSPNNINNYFNGGDLDKGETKKIIFKFKNLDLNSKKLYFVYLDDENGVKIRL